MPIEQYDLGVHYWRKGQTILKAVYEINEGEGAGTVTNFVLPANPESGRKSWTMMIMNPIVPPIIYELLLRNRQILNLFPSSIRFQSNCPKELTTMKRQENFDRSLLSGVKMLVNEISALADGHSTPFSLELKDTSVL